MGNVLSKSLEIARKSGIKTALLPPWNDIDTFQDLLTFFDKHTKQPQGRHWAGKKTFLFLSGLEKFKMMYGCT